MLVLEEKQQSPSLSLIATFVAVITAVAFGGIWACYHAATPTVSHHAAPVEGNG